MTLLYAVLGERYRVRVELLAGFEPDIATVRSAAQVGKKMLKEAGVLHDLVRKDFAFFKDGNVASRLRITAERSMR